MVTKPQPFLSFPLRRPEASSRAQDTLLELFLDGTAGPEAAPLRPPFGFGPPVRKPLDAGVSENTMALLDNLITAEIRRLARTRPRVRAASMANEGPRLRRALRNSRSGAVRPPKGGPRKPSPRSSVAADDAIFDEDQPDPNMVFRLSSVAPAPPGAEATPSLSSNVIFNDDPIFGVQDATNPPAIDGINRRRLAGVRSRNVRPPAGPVLLEPGALARKERRADLEDRARAIKSFNEQRMQRILRASSACKKP